MGAKIKELEVGDYIDILVPTQDYGPVVISAEVIYVIDYNKYLMTSQDRIFIMSGCVGDYDWKISKPIDLLNLALSIFIHDA